MKHYFARGETGIHNVFLLPGTAAKEMQKKNRRVLRPPSGKIYTPLQVQLKLRHDFNLNKILFVYISLSLWLNQQDCGLL